MTKFEKQLQDMFDHIWDCKIDHPVFRDTVGDLMSAVIQAHYNSAQTEIIRCKECKWHFTYHDEKYNVGYELCGNPKMMSGDSMIDMGNNDFCSKAERKDDD